MTLVEAIVLLAVVVLSYRLLRPLQAFLEEAIRRLLDPERRKIIDAKVYDAGGKKSKE